MKYLQIKGLAPKKIHAEMVATLGDDSPALSTVKKWAVEFRRAWESFEDDLSSGCSFPVTTQKNTGCIHDMVMDDRCLAVSHIANVLGISHERVENIFCEEPGLSKVLA